MAEKRPLIAQIQRSLSKIEMAATPGPSIDKTEKQTLSKQRNAQVVCISSFPVSKNAESHMYPIEIPTMKK